jgi:alkyl hydroperoxide reductase subunit AhpF
MSTKHFDCDTCGAHGKVVFKEADYTTSDVVYCPFCGGDIYEEEEIDDEE